MRHLQQHLSQTARTKQQKLLGTGTGADAKPQNSTQSTQNNQHDTMHSAKPITLLSAKPELMASHDKLAAL